MKVGELPRRLHDDVDVLGVVNRCARSSVDKVHLTSSLHLQLVKCLQLRFKPSQIEGALRFRRGHTTMTKAELIEEVAKKADISKADAERTIAAFFELVVASTKKGDKVAWPGFGSFSTTRRKERTGRNPQTGATVVVPASTAMKFSASSTLKAELNPNRK